MMMGRGLEQRKQCDMIRQLIKSDRDRFAGAYMSVYVNMCTYV